MKHFTFCFVALLLVLCCNSCLSEASRTKRLMKSWTGKTIVMPDSVTAYIYRQGICKLPTDSLVPATDYKILLYVDNQGCTSCRLKLYEWNRLMMETRAWNDKRLSYIFILYPKDVDEVINLVKRDRINHPIIIDEVDRINGMNSFPNQEQFQCFLLNRNNKVLYVGNPILNPKLWTFYKNRIASGNQ